ncbi:MAG: hypothetical protein BroJett003_21680 [Planctomycetota bacterium]|nr:MAG: hypothetical protein BroJett003_21680 [Planctomycetota bacterium]
MRKLHTGWSRTLGMIGTLAVPVAAFAQETETLTKDNVIVGTMNIDFRTRTELDTSGDYKAGSPKIGVKDEYKFDIIVADTTQFTGTITRQPNIFTKTLQRSKQSAQLGFDVSLTVMNPKDLKQKKVVGKWVGTVPIDTASGAYQLAGGKAQQSALRIAVDAMGKASAFTDEFAGRLMGKAEKKEGLAAYTYKRVVGKKTVEVKVSKSDPMRFDNIVLGKGPAEVYPRTTVNGRLDYDYETGNWYTDGIRFTYNLNGKEYEDIVTGSIKWVEDPNRESNGKGYYDFNLRFNEEKSRTASGESAAFENMSDEDAFFAVDNSIPCMTGMISYVDTFGGDGDLPTSSQVAFNLNANQLTKAQIMNFFKLWMICIGPTNDE